MIIKSKNFSRARLADFAPQAGDVVENCNLAQLHPHTVITEVSGLTFRACNLVNCDVPADAVVESCNTIQISRCGNLHDDYSCVADCEHVTSSEAIIVDGFTVDTLREYADKVVI